MSKIEIDDTEANLLYFGGKFKKRYVNKSINLSIYHIIREKVASQNHIFCHLKQ